MSHTHTNTHTKLTKCVGLPLILSLTIPPSPVAANAFITVQVQHRVGHLTLPLNVARLRHGHERNGTRGQRLSQRQPKNMQHIFRPVVPLTSK